jgi:hypothetical protein
MLAGTELCWLLPSYVGCYRLMLASTELCWLLTELCWLVLSYTGWRCVRNLQQAYRCVLFVTPLSYICLIQPLTSLDTHLL